MNPKHANPFGVGCVHRNRNGFYVIETTRGEELGCKYLKSGKKFPGLRSRLERIERNLLGYILQSPEESRKVLEKSGRELEGWSSKKIVVEAGRVLEEERKILDCQSIQTLYEAQLRASGKPSGTIRNSTYHRESGCHKCKRTPLVSDLLYECPICGGMVCRSCGSCLCNWEQQPGEENPPPLPMTPRSRRDQSL